MTQPSLCTIQKALTSKITYDYSVKVKYYVKKYKNNFNFFKKTQTEGRSKKI